jgi:outer membrane protein assembly factor BamB
MRSIHFFPRYTYLFLLVTGSCFIAGCISCNNSEAVETKPATWKEFHGNSLNSGFVNFPSKKATVRKWDFPVGDVQFASPVIDDDGTIYIGNAAGFLFAITPYGKQQWKQNVGGTLTTAAIGADGNIYISNILTFNRDAHASVLFSFKPQPTGPVTNWTFLFPDHGYTTAPPKTWSLGGATFIFQTARTDRGNELFVINGAGQPVARVAADCTPDELSGGEDIGFHFRIDGIEFDASVVTNPAVAIADINGITKPGKPVIVIAPDKCHMMAFEWNPQEKTLSRLWTAPGAYYTNPTPVITSGGVVVIGHEKTLSAYQVMTGSKLWDFEEKYPVTIHSFYDTPAILLGTSPIIFTNSGYVLKVEGDGTGGRRFVTFKSVDGLGPPPLVTTTFIYAAFNSGLYTLDFNLKEVAHVDLIPAPNKPFFSAPSIGPDGTIYIVGGAGVLEAF